MKEVKLNIPGYEDRRKLVGILADNGYSVRIEKEDIPYKIGKNYFVVVGMKK